ncbi:MAG TPA: GreA/GreB family elongation factor [Thermoanaerobaculia bacterium]|nr:GreA/GreB family elongation factor [Thermoanaerobaculia bacterium]
MDVTEPKKSRGTGDEEAFAEILARSAEDVESLFSITREMKKRGEKEKPRALLARLAAAQEEQGLYRARLETLLEIARAFPNKAASPEEIADAFRFAWPDHPSLEVLIAHFLPARANVVDAAERLRRWVRFAPGDVYFFAGHGAGRVVELSPAIDAVRFEFEGGEKLSLPPGAAAKNLVPLPPGDFRRDRLEDRAALRERSLADPAGAVRHLIESMGRPVTAAEIKDAFASVVPAERWTSFWNAARKHPQLVVSGTGKNAGYQWRASAEAASDSVREEFTAAPVARRLEIARKNVRRPELLSYFAESLAGEGWREATPAERLEIALFLEEGKSGVAAPVAAADLANAPGGAEVSRALPDPALRWKAYRAIRERDPRWSEVFAELFAGEDDARTLAAIDGALAEGAPAVREALAARIAANPRTAPRAFLWLAEKRAELPHAAALFGPPTLFALLEALRLPEFAPHRAKLKTMFDRGGLALELVARVADEDEARRLLTTAERAPGLEEFRRDDLKQAVHRRFPDLRGPRVEPLYVTPESLEARRAELEQLLTVEMPKNGRAIQEAAAMGDLRENFEYHSARARQEFLAARVATLRGDLARARPLDPARVDTSEVRVGTRVVLTAGERSREAAVLGPWDSRPEEGIYSYQSEFAQKLLGNKPGDAVLLDGEEWRIGAIRPWRET